MRGQEASLAGLLKHTSLCGAGRHTHINSLSAVALTTAPARNLDTSSSELHPTADCRTHLGVGAMGHSAPEVEEDGGGQAHREQRQ